MALNDKEKLFVSAYTGDAYNAAIAAGYKHHTAKNAYEWLLQTLPNPTAKRHLPYKPEVAAAIEQQMAELASKKIADKTEVLEYLTSVMRKESVSAVLARNDLGAEVVIEKTPDEKEALRAAELLGKSNMLFTEKVVQDVDMDLQITVDYGDEE